LRLDERFYADDWGLRATTTDARYSLDLGRRLAIWPHLRFHAQTGVRFWHRAYEAERKPSGEWQLPAYRTGDRELGPLYTLTLGAGARLRLGSDVRTRFWLVLEADGAMTRYLDALFLLRRRALFSTLAFEAELE
jgi:hypothetical protein